MGSHNLTQHCYSRINSMRPVVPTLQVAISMVGHSNAFNSMEQSYS
jgi:hypothetical protein